VNGCAELLEFGDLPGERYLDADHRVVAVGALQHQIEATTGE
jgi:hypothetical protein